jgi:hypothetical protein
MQPMPRSLGDDVFHASSLVARGNNCGPIFHSFCVQNSISQKSGWFELIVSSGRHDRAGDCECRTCLVACPFRACLLQCPSVEVPPVGEQARNMDTREQRLRDLRPGSRGSVLARVSPVPTFQAMQAIESAWRTRARVASGSTAHHRGALLHRKNCC